MIRNYITQAITMMRQHKLFSGIYIGGTAISLALAMALFIAFNVQLAPAYPEYCRDRLIYFPTVECDDFTGGPYEHLRTGGELPDEFIPYAEDIEGIKHLSVTRRMSINQTHVDGQWLEDASFYCSCVDEKFWEIFDFNFIHGTPFGKDELHDAKIIITASTANTLFARTDVVGKRVTFNLDGKGNSTEMKEFTITGVVEDAHECMTYTTKEVFFTLYTNNNKHNHIDTPFEFIGQNQIIIEAEDMGSIERVKKELDERYARYCNEVLNRHNYKDFKYTARIYSHWQNVFNCEPGDTVWDVFKNYFYVFLALLFIPALNLSGMISSRMKSRLSEIGVRKAYGATSARILWQVLWENLFLTFLGALIGLVLSYLLSDLFIKEIIAMYQGWIDECEYSAALLYSPRVFVTTLLLCFVLNIVSALLPAVIALRKNIVHSLYNKR